MNRFDVIPGFEAALGRWPLVARAYDDLCRQLDDCGLSGRELALIAVATAMRSGSQYVFWAKTCAARREGLSEEDIFLATIFTARDRREAKLLRFTGQVLARGDPGFGMELAIDDTRAVIAAVTLGAVVNLVAARLAPSTGIHSGRKVA